MSLLTVLRETPIVSAICGHVNCLQEGKLFVYVVCVIEVFHKPPPKPLVLGIYALFPVSQL
jgi:hypothetical protein